MTKYSVLTVVFVCSWFAVAQAQVDVEPDARKDGVFVGEQHSRSREGSLYNNLPYSRNVNSDIGRHRSGDSDRYMERYNSQGGKSDSTIGIGSVYNPYTIHWR